MTDTTHTNRQRLCKVDCLIHSIIELNAAKHEYNNAVLMSRLESLVEMAHEASTSHDAVFEFLDSRNALDLDPKE